MFGFERFHSIKTKEETKSKTTQLLHKLGLVFVTIKHELISNDYVTYQQKVVALIQCLVFAQGNCLDGDMYPPTMTPSNNIFAIKFLDHSYFDQQQTLLSSFVRFVINFSY